MADYAPKAPRIDPKRRVSPSRVYGILPQVLKGSDPVSALNILGGRDLTNVNPNPAPETFGPFMPSASPMVPMLGREGDYAEEPTFPVSLQAPAQGEGGEEANPYGIPEPTYDPLNNNFRRMTTPLPTAPQYGQAPQYDPQNEQRRFNKVFEYAKYVPLLAGLMGVSGQDTGTLTAGLLGGTQQGARQGAQYDYQTALQNWQSMTEQQKRQYEAEMQRYNAESLNVDRENSTIEATNRVTQQGNEAKDRSYNRKLTIAQLREQKKRDQEQRQQQLDDTKFYRSQVIKQKYDSDESKFVRAKMSKMFDLAKSGALSIKAEEDFAKWLEDPKNKELVLDPDFRRELTPWQEANIDRWTKDRETRYQMSVDDNRAATVRLQSNIDAQWARQAERFRLMGELNKAKGVGGFNVNQAYTKLDSQLKNSDVQINRYSGFAQTAYDRASKILLDKKNRTRDGLKPYAQAEYDRNIKLAQNYERQVQTRKQAYNATVESIQSLLAKSPYAGVVQAPQQYPGVPPITLNINGQGVTGPGVVGSQGQGLPNINANAARLGTFDANGNAVLTPGAKPSPPAANNKGKKKAKPPSGDVLNSTARAR